MHADPYLSHFKEGTRLTLKISDEFPFKWSNCNNKAPNLGDFEFSYSYNNEMDELKVVFNEDIPPNTNIILDNIFIENFEDGGSGILEEVGYETDFIKFYISEYDTGFEYKVNNEKKLNESPLRMRENYGYSSSFDFDNNKNNGIQYSRIKINFENLDPLNFQTGKKNKIKSKPINPFRLVFDNFETLNLPDSILIRLVTAVNANNDDNIDLVWDIESGDKVIDGPLKIVGTDAENLILKIDKEYWSERQGIEFNGEILLENDNLKIRTDQYINTKNNFYLEVELYEKNECAENKTLYSTRRVPFFPKEEGTTNTTDCLFSTLDYEPFNEDEEIILIVDSQNPLNKMKFKRGARLVHENNEEVIGKVVASSYDSDSIRFKLLKKLEPEQKYRIENIRFDFFDNSRNQRGKGQIKIDIGGTKFSPALGYFEHYPDKNDYDKVLQKESSVQQSVENKQLCLFEDGQIDLRKGRGPKDFLLEFKIKSADNPISEFNKRIEQILNNLKMMKSNPDLEDYKMEFKVNKVLTELDELVREISPRYSQLSGESERYRVDRKHANYHFLLSILYSMRGIALGGEYEDYAMSHFGKSGATIKKFNEHCDTTPDEDCSGCCFSINDEPITILSEIFAEVNNKDSELSDSDYIKIEENLYKIRLNSPKAENLYSQVEKELEKKLMDDEKIDYEFKYAKIHLELSRAFDDHKFIDKQGSKGLKKKFDKMEGKFDDYESIDFDDIDEIIQESWNDFIMGRDEDWIIGSTIQGKSLLLSDFREKEKYRYLNYNYESPNFENQEFSLSDLNLQAEAEPIKLNIISDNIFYDQAFKNRYNIDMFPLENYDNNSGVKLYSEGSYLLIIDDPNLDEEKIESDKTKLNVMLGLFLGSMLLGSY